MALVYGSTGEDVKALQKQLNSLGYNLDVDGSFGPATQDAVKKYQAKNGLAVDGSVGPQTSASLSANANKTPTTTNTGGAKTLNEKMYEGINASISAATPETDKYGNTIRTASKEAVDDADAFLQQQIAVNQDIVNQLYGKDEVAGWLSNIVAPEGGVDRSSRPKFEAQGGGADYDLLDDKSWLAIHGEGGLTDQWWALEAQKANATDAERKTIEEKQNELHLQAESIRYWSRNVLPGYLGGTDGSMNLPSWHFNTGKVNSAVPNALGGTGNVQGGSSFDRTQSGSSSGGSSSGGSSSGNLASGDYGVNSYEQYIKEMYAAQKAAALAAIDAAYKQNVNAIDRAGAGLDEAYQAARNQTAGASELAKRNFAQYAAANGLNSGTGGQADLARNVALQNNLNAINMQEAQSVADLELQKANAEVEYNKAIAQAEAEGNFELANALYEEKVRYENAMNAAIQQEFQNNLALMQYNNSVKQQAWQNAFAEKQYNDGLTQQNWQNNLATQQYLNSLTQQNWQNDFAMQQYQDALAQQQYENYLAALKAESSAETNPVLSWSQLQEALASGNMSPAAIAAFEAYNKVPYADYVKYGSDFGQLTAAYSIPQDIRSMLEQNFPGGYITGDQRWQSWVNRYGEDALKAAGFDYISSSTLDWAKKVLNANGGDVDYLAYALEANGYTEDQIASILSHFGLLK